jgi:hypothetical protein
MYHCKACGLEWWWLTDYQAHMLDYHHDTYVRKKSKRKPSPREDKLRKPTAAERKDIRAAIGEARQKKRNYNGELYHF